MITRSIKTEEVQRRWYVVDANQKTLGRLATKVAHHLRGKHKPEYTPHVDLGDYIVVINASKITVTGNKMKNKIYYRHSGYPGGISSTSLEEMLKEHPDRVISQAVKGMLPRSRLGRLMYTKLKVYADETHPHAAQKPEPLLV